jgi:transposase
MRKDLGVLRPGDEIAVDLKILVRRRTDLINDRTRQVNRLPGQLLEIFPALERSLSLTNKGPLLLLTGYQTPAAIPPQRRQAHRDLTEESQGQRRSRSRSGGC